MTAGYFPAADHRVCPLERAGRIPASLGIDTNVVAPMGDECPYAVGPGQLDVADRWR